MNQRMVEKKGGEGRALSFENRFNSYRTANQIREGEEHQIRSIRRTGSDDFTSLDMPLAQRARSGKITRDAAMHYCQDVKVFQEM